MTEESRNHPLRQAGEDWQTARTVPDTPQTRSPAYRLAFTDDEFLCRDELRPVRLQLELMKATHLMDAAEVDSTIVLFGGARVPRPENAAGARTDTLRDLAGQYEEARRFARMVTERSLAETGGRENVIVTGGGPGVMEAGNRGAIDAGGRSIGLNIVLPHEQAPNEYVTPELSFNFHYFAIRKMHFLMRAAAICVFPGGFGTLDELFEALTLIQTGRMRRVPFLLFGEAFWRSIVNWEALEAAGTIGADDLELFRFVETAEQAMGYMDDWPLPRTRRDTIPGRVEA
ncbi:LOG family protein [uncultured Jannaschia sp.]|uniref:LOG family protein n=1 Tax=uncultured Jannaschia sp. TaxID=293347 RepID=UPI00262A055A|nr:LOG family protein [uncultured Jannaschia sp.]